MVEGTKREETVAKVVRAERLELVREDGQQSLELYVSPAGTAGITFRDGQGRPRMVMSLRADGSPQLSLNDESGNSCIALVILPDGTANLCLQEPGRSAGANLQLQVGPSGVPTVSMADENGALRVRLGMSPDASGLALYDEDGNVHASLVVFSDGSPGLALLDQHGEMVWSAP
jgi:hypothetical protein